MGNSGNQKMMNLFRKAKRVYLKGKSIVEFIDHLDLSKIRMVNRKTLSEFETLLNITIDNRSMD